jgi:hypothetical protein
VILYSICIISFLCLFKKNMTLQRLHRLRQFNTLHSNFLEDL